MSNIDIIKEYYNKFPEPYKTKALENLEKYPKGSLHYNEISNNKNALYYGFYWTYNEDGYQYWMNFYNSLIESKPALNLHLHSDQYDWINIPHIVDYQSRI